MAETFDISKHIKVEVLGSRQADVVNPDTISVNGIYYPSSEYSLTPVGLGTATQLSLIDDVNPDYFIRQFPENSRNYITMVWKPVAGATSYNIYRGNGSSSASLFQSIDSSQTTYTMSEYLGGYEFTSFKVTAIVGGLEQDVIAQPDGEIYGFVETNTSDEWWVPVPSSDDLLGWKAGGILDDGVVEGLSIYDSARYQLAIDAPYVEGTTLIIGISGSGNAYPQYYVTSRGIAGKSALYKVLIPSSEINEVSTKVTISRINLDNTITPITEYFYGPKPISDVVNPAPTILTPTKPQHDNDQPFNALYLWDWDGNINTFDWETSYGETPGSVSDPGTQAYHLYKIERDVDNFTAADIPSETGELLYSKGIQTTGRVSVDLSNHTGGKYALYSAYKEIYSDYNFVFTYEILRPDLVDSISAEGIKQGTAGVDDRVVLTTNVIYAYPLNEPEPDRAYWYQRGARVTQSQDYIDVPDPLPNGGYEWVSNPLPQYTPNPPNPPLPGSPGFPGQTDTYEMEMRDQTGNFAVAVRVLVYKEVVTSLVEIGRQVVYKDADGSKYPGGASYVPFERLDASTIRFRSTSIAQGELYVGMTGDNVYPSVKFTNGYGLLELLFSYYPDNLDDYFVRFFEYDGTVQYQKVVGDPYEFIYGDYVIAYGWWPIECSVSSCDIETGYEIEKGLLKTGEPGTASIALKGSEGNPITNTALSLDNKITIKLDAAASPDGTEDYLFSGFIETWSTNYDTEGNEITQITCVDGLSRALNVNIPLYDIATEESFSQRMYNVFNTYIGPATTGVSYDINTIWPLLEPFDGSVFPPEYREDVSTSEIIDELTHGEYGIVAQNRGGVIFWFNRSAPTLFYDPTLVLQTGDFGFSTEHSDSLNHHCISDFTIRNSMDDVTNKVIASLTYDELTGATYEDATSIAKYGERSYEVALNLYAPSGNQTQYLDAWLADVPYAEDYSEIESVTTNVVNRKGLVTRAYQYDITYDPIRIFIQKGALDINGVWFAKRITHSITPDNWTMEVILTAD